MEDTKPLVASKSKSNGVLRPSTGPVRNLRVDENTTHLSTEQSAGSKKRAISPELKAEERDEKVKKEGEEDVKNKDGREHKKHKRQRTREPNPSPPPKDEVKHDRLARPPKVAFQVDDPSRPIRNANFQDLTSWGIAPFPYPANDPDYPPLADILAPFTRQGRKTGKEFTGGEIQWINSNNLCLMETENVIPEVPGEPFIFWDDSESCAEVERHCKANALGVMCRKSSDKWCYLGHYEVAWRGTTKPGELMGYLRGNQPLTKKWHINFHGRITRPKGRYPCLRSSGFGNDEKASQMVTRMDEDPSIVFEICVMKCVGYDKEGLNTWVDNRRAMRPNEAP